MEQVSLWAFVLQTAWGYLSSQAFREWCLFGAEILVAWVIYLEVRHGRNVDFLEKATNYDANENRRVMYNEFEKLAGTLDERANAFCKMILEPDKEGLRKACERQIALFNDLGFSCRKPFWSIFGRFENPLVFLLPHATISVWVVLKPYIVKRRQVTGPWYATPLLKFTVRSVDFVLRHKRGLSVSNDQGKGVDIKPDELKLIRVELCRLLKDK